MSAILFQHYVETELSTLFIIHCEYKTQMRDESEKPRDVNNV